LKFFEGAAVAPGVGRKISYSTKLRGETLEDDVKVTEGGGEHRIGGKGEFSEEEVEAGNQPAAEGLCVSCCDDRHVQD
jgi:hypothetical protein